MEVLVDSRNRVRSAIWVITAMVALLGLSLLGSRVGVAQESSPEASPAASPAATPEAGGAEVTVVSHDIYFEPDELSIPADTDVTVKLPNEGVTLHNFAIDELYVDVDIDPGAEEETIINAPAGEYEYYCNVPGHKEAGMLGTMTVE
jgi:plastocyanin